MNTLYAGGVPYGFIDWDMAGPAGPLHDLASAAIAYTALRPDRYWPRPGCPDPPDRPARLRLFCDAYDVDDRLALLDAIEAFQRTAGRGSGVRTPGHFRRTGPSLIVAPRAALAGVRRGRKALDRSEVEGVLSSSESTFASRETAVDMTQENAARLLVEADRAGQSVERRAPKEYMPFIGWGLFNAVVIPGFDFFDRRMWGWITIGVAVAGLVATFAYFLIRSMQVEVKHRSPWWTWVVLGLWIALASFIGPALDDTTTFAYTLAGLVAAAPLLAWGLRLRRGA